MTFPGLNTRVFWTAESLKNLLFLLKNAGETVNTPAYFSPNVYAGQPERPSNGLYTQPANLYYLHSGFFCKREWEFEKTTHVPFRFRLGSLADCNALEGKH